MKLPQAFVEKVEALPGRVSIAKGDDYGFSGTAYIGCMRPVGKRRPRWACATTGIPLRSLNDDTAAELADIVCRDLNRSLSVGRLNGYDWVLTKRAFAQHYKRSCRRQWNRAGRRRHKLGARHGWPAGKGDS